MDEEDGKEYGRQTPNGNIDWVPAPAFWGTAAGREQAQIDFQMSLDSLGVEKDESLKLKFFSRTKTVSYTEPVELDI